MSMDIEMNTGDSHYQTLNKQYNINEDYPRLSLFINLKTNTYYEQFNKIHRNNHHLLWFNANLHWL